MRPQNRFFLFWHCLIIVSCHDKGVELEAGGPGLIVPGRSVEGLKLGDSKEIVEAKLGEPTSRGYADGLYRGWRGCAYLDGAYAGLDFLFLDNGSTYGPLDVIIIDPPYSGKTKEGVGIGSTLAEVRQAYGSPQTTLIPPQTNYILDTYCINGKHFNVGYRDSMVTGFNIGYYLPMPEDSSYSCR